MIYAQLDNEYRSFATGSSEDVLGRQIYHWFKNDAYSKKIKLRQLASMKELASPKTRKLLTRMEAVARAN